MTGYLQELRFVLWRRAWAQILDLSQHTLQVLWKDRQFHSRTCVMQWFCILNGKLGQRLVLTESNTGETSWMTGWILMAKQGQAFCSTRVCWDKRGYFLISNPKGQILEFQRTNGVGGGKLLTWQKSHHGPTAWSRHPTVSSDWGSGHSGWQGGPDLFPRKHHGSRPTESESIGSTFLALRWCTDTEEKPYQRSILTPFPG